MKMRSETSAACHEIDRLVRDQVRFDGGDTVAYDPFHLVEGADQVDKRLPGALPEVADVDACQHDLFSPACFTMLAIVPLRLRPRAKGIVQ